MLDENRQPAATAARPSYPGVIGQNPMYAQYNNGGHYNRPNDTYLHPQQMGTGNRNDMQALAENFGRVNLQANVKQGASMPGQCYDGGKSWREKSGLASARAVIRTMFLIRSHHTTDTHFQVFPWPAIFPSLICTMVSHTTSSIQHKACSTTTWPTPTACTQVTSTQLSSSTRRT